MKMKTAMMLAALGLPAPKVKASQSDWRHDPERARKAEAKRQRKNAKRLMVSVS